MEWKKVKEFLGTEAQVLFRRLENARIRVTIGSAFSNLFDEEKIARALIYFLIFEHSFQDEIERIVSDLEFKENDIEQLSFWFAIDKITKGGLFLYHIRVKLKLYYKDLEVLHKNYILSLNEYIFYAVPSKFKKDFEELHRFIKHQI